VTARVGRSNQILLPLSLHISLVDTLGLRVLFEVATQSLLKLLGIALDPSEDRRLVDLYAALRDRLGGTSIALLDLQ
jgi:hypothetical protein